MTDSPETRILQLAERQHGVVTRRHVLALGLTGRMVAERVRQGRLRPLHRGVYGVGPALSPHMRDMAALLACGRSAMLSHGSAAELNGLADPRPNLVGAPPALTTAPPVTVTVVGRDPGRRPGIRGYRVARIPPDEVVEIHGMRATSVPRTLFDLAGDPAAACSSRRIGQMLTRAERLGLTNAAELWRMLSLYPRRPGAALIRALLGAHGTPAFTRSAAEEKFLELAQAGNLPAPVCNALVAGCEVDFLWVAERVVVEIDGFAYHSSRQRFENDRQRDRRLEAAGFTVVRMTWRQLTREPLAVVATVGLVLGRRGAHAPR